MRRRRGELDERAATERPQGQAGERRHAVHHAGATGRMRGIEVDEGGAQRRQRRTRGDPLRDSRERQHRNVTRDREQQQRERLERHCRGEHRSPADVVGQRAEDQQRPEQGHDVDGEHDRQCRGREAPPLLVDDIQRRGRARRSGEQPKIAVIARKAVGCDRHGERAGDPEGAIAVVGGGHGMGLLDGSVAALGTTLGGDCQMTGYRLRPAHSGSCPTAGAGVAPRRVALYSGKGWRGAGVWIGRGSSAVLDARASAVAMATVTRAELRLPARSSNR